MAAAIPADTRATFRFSFFLCMTIVMTVFIFSGLPFLHRPIPDRHVVSGRAH